MTTRPLPEDFDADDPGLVWSELARSIDRFAAAWDGETPPRIADFLPPDPLELRELALVELIKLDLERRWATGGDRRSLESYVEEFPELDAASLPADLLYEEAHIRRQAGDEVAPGEYTRRFPAQVGELGRLLGDTVTEGAQIEEPSSESDVAVGDVIDDFELLSELGRGSFARVYLARQRSMLRLVALKVSRASSDEPRTLAQLNHPDIVRVHDQRVLPDRKLHLLYMEYVPGGTLRDVIQRVSRSSEEELSGGTLVRAVDESLDLTNVTREIDATARTRLEASSWPSAVARTGARIARALDYAHRRGVRHHDIKPANVLLTADCSPKLADFNVSNVHSELPASGQSSVGGSLAYMSPEHIDAFRPGSPVGPQDLDERTDIYSLGVLLWELLFGTRPFDDPSGVDASALDELAARRRDEAPRRPERARATAEYLVVEQILRRCMNPDPEERFASAAELAAELEIAAERRVAKLLRAPSTGWIGLARSFALPVALFLALAPHVLAGVFNFVYNRRAIVESIPDGESVLDAAQLGINSVAFPIGIVMGVWWLLPIARALGCRSRGRAVASEECAPVRLRALRLGHWVALLGLVEWLVAGIAYPVVFRVATGPLPTSVHAHFLTSLALCGLIAMAYPFFGVTSVAVRAWYPTLLGCAGVSAEEIRAITTVRRRSWIYLALSASVPMLATVLLVFLGSGDRLVLGVLTAVALLGFVVVLLLFRALQEDLAALLRVADILEQAYSGSQRTPELVRR